MALNSKYICKYMCVLTVLLTANYVILNLLTDRRYDCDQTYLESINTMSVLKERKINEAKKCESCLGNVPDFILQYGFHRTATTFQFQILCLCMAMLHEDEIDSVGCYHEMQNKSLKYKVIKTHNISSLLTKIPSNSWIFMTSSDVLSQTKQLTMNIIRQEIHDKNLTIPYTADIDLVSKRGHHIVYEYQNVFGLSDEKMQHILEYFRYWDILRLCCGLQMSSDWRNRLSPKAGYTQRHDIHSPTYPACEMYNIQQVEKLLIDTYAFKKFAHIDSLRVGIGRVSNLDGQLDGRYCKRCNENISKRHLGINEKCT